MTKATIKRLFPKKQYCIINCIDNYWQGDCVWYDHEHAYVGTKKEMTVILNNYLYQHKLRGARVVKF